MSTPSVKGGSVEPSLQPLAADVPAHQLGFVKLRRCAGEGDAPAAEQVDAVGDGERAA